MMDDRPSGREQLRDQHALIAAAWGQAEHAALQDSGSTVVDTTASAASVTHALPGYRITREIHRGGQGVVYEAVQQSTGRTVAVKMLHGGPFAGPAERARFEREVQLLARLKHPNIVTIHDSGSVGAANYCVMDYIAGDPLDRYVERVQPTLRDRLRLFAKICAAVNVAHLNGIIHRDLKPGNVRVDAQGEPHVLDFGLARLAAWEQADSHEALTLTGQFVGSLPWASPEQAEGRPDEIDVRTDVYALGVILYHLLTGTFPYRVLGPLREVIDAIVHMPPGRPRELNRAVDEELETIVLKALRKDRDGRYQSAGELGHDVERYLAGEPIEAKRDSFTYVLRKHLLRHKMTATVLAGYVALVTIGFAVALTLWRQTARAQRAEVRLRSAAQASAASATAEAEKAQAVNTFLTDLLTTADPTGRYGPKVTVRDAVAAAAARLERGAFADQPLIEASVRGTVGMTYLRLGELEPAETHLQRSLTLLEEHPDAPRRQLAEAVNNLGMLRRAQGNPAAADTQFRRALELLAAVEPPDNRAKADVLNNYGLVLQEEGKLPEAEAQFTHALELGRAELRGPRATTLNNLALVVRERGDVDRATALWQEALQLLRAEYGEDHMHVAAVLESLGSVANMRGRPDEARENYEEALAIRRRVVGDEHPDTASSLNALGYFYYTQREYDLAESYYREALALRRQLLGDTHPAVAVVLNNLGLLYLERGDLDQAEPYFTEALEIKEATLAPNHPSTLLQRGNLASLWRRQGRVAEAEALICETYRAGCELLSPEHAQVAAFGAEWGVCLAELGRTAEAEQALQDAYAVFVKRYGPQHLRTTNVVSRLADVCEQSGQTEKAAQWRALLAASPTLQNADQ